MALVKRKKEMEEKLTKIEKAIETFSKKVVYIAIWKISLYHDIIINYH